MSEETRDSAIVRSPSGPWGRIWVLALSIVALILATQEARLRIEGYQASVPDTAELLARARARASSPDAIAILGSSRIQCAIDLEVLSAAFGDRRTAQLALFGSTPLPVLEELASAERFRGLVISEVTPHIFFDSARTDERVRQRLRAADFARRSPGRMIDLELSLFLNSILLLANPDHELTRPPAEGEPHGRTVMTPERMVKVTGDRDVLAQRTRDSSAEIAISPDPAAIINRASAAVERIVARGGEVVFITLPQTDTRASFDKLHFPRDRYFDALPLATGARGIDYHDFPSLADFKCVDAQHIDARDAPAFTQALARILLGH